MGPESKKKTCKTFFRLKLWEDVDRNVAFLKQCVHDSRAAVAEVLPQFAPLHPHQL